MHKKHLLAVAKGYALRRKTRTTDPYLWIFSSTDNSHFNYNSRALFLYVKEHVPEVTPRFVINDPVRREQLSEQYGAKYFIDTTSEEGITTALRAGVWITSAGLPVYGTGLDRNRSIVNLWHGIPLKKIALLDPSLRGLARLYFRKIFSKNYTDVVTTSRSLVKIMAESFGVSEEVVRVWGQPRNDVLFGPKKDLAAMFKDAAGTKYILYAPTFRTGRKTELFPFEDFDRARLEAELEKRQTVLLLHTHLFGEEGRDFSSSQRIRKTDESADVMELLCGADLLITDYSSIYFDYLLTGRPIVFLPYDRAQYEAEHGFNFNYEEVTPGPKPTTMETFVNAISDALAGKDEYRQAREELNAKMNEIQNPCAGEICARLLQRIKEQDKV